MTDLRLLTEKEIEKLCLEEQTLDCPKDCQNCSRKFQLAADQKVVEGLQARIKELEGLGKRIEDMLDIHENESGWIRISNHVNYSDWQSLKEGKERI